jgi:mono/diheme cytochrome c family protein
MKKLSLPLFLVFAMLFLLALSLGAQQKPEVKMAPVPYSKPESGAAMYKDYCAACHGLTGKGDGPAAVALKSPVPDLTTLSKRNGGVFPDAKLAYILTHGGSSTGVHGSEDMPIWGNLFKSVNTDLVKLRIANLTNYLKTLQQK